MRLIDGDALYDALREAGMVFALRMVEAAPTIAPPPNDPLTLEELREMDGEPVWVEYISSPGEECTGLWALISIDKEYDGIFLLNSIGGSSSYEEALADIRAIYRRKPEEGATWQQ